MSKRPSSRWFAFRLRTTFVVVAVVAVPMAWAAYSLNWIRERRAAMRMPGVFAAYDAQLFDAKIYGAPGQAPWTIRVFGERRVSNVCYIELPGRTTSALHEELCRLFPEAYVYETGALLDPVPFSVPSAVPPQP